MGDTKFRQTGRRTAQGPFRRDELERKRTEGEARNVAWRALTPSQQLASLAERGVESGRQYRKLTGADK